MHTHRLEENFPSWIKDTYKTHTANIIHDGERLGIFLLKSGKVKNAWSTLPGQLSKVKKIKLI